MRRKSARFLSVFLPVVVAACSSEPGPTAPGPAVAVALVLSGLATSMPAGAANVTVTATDISGHTVIGYTGTIHFTATDPAADLPTNYTFVGADAGTHTFPVTLKTVGSETLAAIDVTTNSITGKLTVTVTPGAAATLVVSGLPSSVAAGAPVTGTVTAKDAFGNTAIGYAGTVHFTSSDPAAQSPSDYAFVGADQGSHSFTVTFETTGPQTVTASDVAASSIKGSATVSVTPRVLRASDVFAVGLGGTIRHYDGTSWTTQPSGTTASLHGVWGTSGSDVFVVGDSILHYDGTSWTAMRISALFAVWGTSGHDVFAVGDYASVLHYDGTTWTLQAAPGEGGTPWEFDGVWGSSGTDVFAVGQAGAIWHYDGTNWTEQTRGATQFLWAVWGSSQTR